MVVWVDEEQNLALIYMVRKGGKKGGPEKGKMEESCSFNHCKKNLSYVTCFMCHKKGYYDSQCLEKRNGRDKEQWK